MKERIAKAATPNERAKLEAALSVTEAHHKAVQETVVKPPNVTFTDKMVIHKGGREVQLLFLGRGHTGGDTMVFLPAERILFTGDFFEGRPGGGVLSYLGDAFIDEWSDSLERMKSLEFDMIVPGHGAPLKERKQIDDFQLYLREFWRQATACATQGLTAQQAVEKIDLSKVSAPYGANAARRPIRAPSCAPTSYCRSRCRCKVADPPEPSALSTARGTSARDMSGKCGRSGDGPGPAAVFGATRRFPD